MVSKRRAHRSPTGQQGRLRFAEVTPRACKMHLGVLRVSGLQKAALSEVSQHGLQAPQHPALQPSDPTGPRMAPRVIAPWLGLAPRRAASPASTSCEPGTAGSTRPCSGVTPSHHRALGPASCPCPSRPLHQRQEQQLSPSGREKVTSTLPTKPMFQDPGESPASGTQTQMWPLMTGS